MIEAWLVLPALALAYLVGGAVAPGSPNGAPRDRRARHRGGVAQLDGVVSLWPAVTARTSTAEHNSIFSQVFVYNGFGRVDQASPNQLLTRAIGLRFGSPAPGWDRLLNGGVGHDTAWLIPAALIALVGCLLAGRGREGRLLRVSVALWGTWLIVLLVVFSASSTINPYYTAALSPPIAALLGTAGALAWERRSNSWVRLAVATTVVVSAAYAVWLLPGRGVGLVAGLPEAVIVLALAAILLLAIGARPWQSGAVALAAVAIIAVPAVASASVASNAFGPFDTPFESAADSGYARTLGQVGARTEALLPPLERAKGTQPDLLATQTSAVAAPFIYDTGEEVVPIGGFTGTIPEPSLSSLQGMVARGDFHLVIQAPTVTDPRLVWVADHCFPLKPAAAASGGLRFVAYFCGRLGLEPGCAGVLAVAETLGQTREVTARLVDTSPDDAGQDLHEAELLVDQLGPWRVAHAAQRPVNPPVGQLHRHADVGVKFGSDRQMADGRLGRGVRDHVRDLTVQHRMQNVCSTGKTVP